MAGIANRLPFFSAMFDHDSPAAVVQRQLDAYNARDPLVGWLRQHGVTTLHTGHAPAALVSGGTMIVKTRGDEVDDAVVTPLAMIAVTLGQDGLAGEGKRPSRIRPGGGEREDAAPPDPGPQVAAREARRLLCRRLRLVDAALQEQGPSEHGGSASRFARETTLAQGVERRS